MLSQTKHFRSAIASDAPTNFASLYDTFCSAYRFGDSGDPRTGQLLQMLQFERGVYLFAIEQGEEYFTALYRQGVRAEFLRYAGEWHTISNRENALDLWKRIERWLKETMASRR